MSAHKAQFLSSKNEATMRAIRYILEVEISIFSKNLPDDFNGDTDYVDLAVDVELKSQAKSWKALIITDLTAILRNWPKQVKFLVLSQAHFNIIRKAILPSVSAPIDNSFQEVIISTQRTTIRKND